MTASPSAFVHRDLLIALAARHKLPAIYPTREFIITGGLFAYGPDILVNIAMPPATSIVSSRARSQPTCQCRRQPSTRSSISTAKALGLTVPPSLLARADEVNE